MMQTAISSRMPRSAVASAIVAAIVLLVSHAAIADVVVDRVLAVVNGHLITLSDVRTVLTLHLVDPQKEPDVTGAALERLVDRMLILDEVDRYAPPEPDRSAVDARLAEVERLGPADRTAWLASLGVSEAWLRQWLRDDLRMRSYIELRFSEIAQATDDDLENYFRQHQPALAGTPQTAPSAEAQQVAREQLREEKRRVIVADWIAGLRRRADITRPSPR